MGDSAFAQAGSDLISTPPVGTIVVAPQPTGGQGLALDPTGHFNPNLIKGYPNNTTTFLRGDGTWATIAQAYAQICDLTLSGSQASFDTNTILGGNIPQTFNHLRFIIQLREDDAVAVTNALIRFNNDSGANYNHSRVIGNNNTASALQAAGNTSFGLAESVGSTASANKFAISEFLVTAYAQTTAQKTILGMSHTDGSDTAATLATVAISGTWKSTAAVTRIQVLPGSGNFVAGSRFTLYGIT